MSGIICSFFRGGAGGVRLLHLFQEFSQRITLFIEPNLALQFLHPIKVGDLIILKARVTCVFQSSLEVEVRVFSEETLTGRRQRTSHAYLTFVAIDRGGSRLAVPPLLLETDEERRVAEEAKARRAERLREKIT